MASNPTLLVQPIAQNGNKNAIPNTTSTPGAMSQSLGFPPETSLPLGAGGVAPSREDFNGVFNLLSGIAFYAQKGWVFAWNSGQAYYKGCEVIDPTDGKKYRCKADVSAGATKPSSNTTSWELAAVDLSAYAPINSPAFTGTPTAPTAATGTNTTQIATTAFVKRAVDGIDLSAYAPKASPALTGTPTAPTASTGTNTTQIATTAFVKAEISSLALKYPDYTSGVTWTYNPTNSYDEKTYTAPSNGWFSYSLIEIGQNNSSYVKINGNKVSELNGFGSNGTTLNAMIPVKNGDVITVSAYYYPSIPNTLIFFPTL